jgi:hypothetical protein
MPEKHRLSTTTLPRPIVRLNRARGDPCAIKGPPGGAGRLGQLTKQTRSGARRAALLHLGYGRC